MTPSFQYTPKAASDHPVVNSLEQRLRNLSPEAREAARQFPLLVPEALASRIDWGRDGPLTRSYLPAAEELTRMAGDSTDPLDEAAARIVPGLIVKYPGRALLKVTAGCAVHCRFCFRRHARHDVLPRKRRKWQSALTAIGADGSLREVILSGGDPLTLSDRRLARLTRRLAAIPHLTRLRIHTRMPVVSPERVTPGLIRWLKGTRLTPFVVVHVNHADELDSRAGQALGFLVDAGIPVLNQSVLLKGVNDDPEILAALCETLIGMRVIPYYLHMLDPVAGASHFGVSEERALAVMAGASARLPGYALPRLVRELPGGPGKRWLPFHAPL
ncbi:MAG: KamA family radical SAM protein [Magnetococcales bacterium]|nr:KamA family radical SAM protein [Magnetococcales bacterium]